MRRAERKTCRETTAVPEIRCKYCNDALVCHMEMVAEHNEETEKRDQERTQ